jgi:hypothetical protein
MTIPNALPTLSAGAHRPDEGKACLMEYVSLLAGEEWSDAPSCTYRPLARAAQTVNDRLSDDARHLLVPLIGRLFGTTLPVDDRLFALRVARTVEHLSPDAKATNDVTERYLTGDATVEEFRAAAYASVYAADVAYAYVYASVYAADVAYAYVYAADAADVAYAAAYDASDAAAAAVYAADVAAAAAADRDLVAWLSSVIDIYDKLSGRTEHRDVSQQELTELALAVQR